MKRSLWDLTLKEGWLQEEKKEDKNTMRKRT